MNSNRVTKRDIRETRTCVYWVRPDGIIVQEVKKGALQTLEDAKVNVATFNAMAGDSKRLALCDGRGGNNVERGVREYYASDEAGRCVLAMAMLIESAVNRAFGNLFLTVSPPKFPLKLFTGEDDAIAWLLRFKPK